MSHFEQIPSVPVSSVPLRKTTRVRTESGLIAGIPVPFAHVPGTSGYKRVRTGTDGIKAGLFFHWFNNGRIENQGHLLALNESGRGRAQLFEWFWGEPSKVIEVTPDYLSACVFYTTCDAMNKAYARWEASHD